MSIQLSEPRRLERIVQTNELKGIRVLVTGCGYKPIQTVFYDVVTGEPSHDSIIVNGEEMKLNIGSAITGVLAQNGAKVHMVSISPDKLKNIKESIDAIVGKEAIEFSAIDLLDEKQVRQFIEELPKDEPLYWVQSIGLGAGSYKLKDDNPYLPLEEISLELIEKESQILLRSTHLMMKELLPRFRKQNESRIVIVTSMSAIRGYSYGGTHCAAKGAIDRYTNVAMLSEYQKNIFISTVRPGAVDTGMYDNPAVQETVKAIMDDEYGLNWRNKGMRLAPPTSVGEAVNYIFTTSAHIPSLNLVARGQMPHEGS